MGQKRRRVRKLDALLGKDELYGDRIAVDRQLAGDGLGAEPGTTYYFWIVNKAGTDSKTSNTVSGKTKAQIAAFAWTSDDASYIAAGRP